MKRYKFSNLIRVLGMAIAAGLLPIACSGPDRSLGSSFISSSSSGSVSASSASSTSSSSSGGRSSARPSSDKDDPPGELRTTAYPTVHARNPNIWADVPDMSILRINDTYYMSSTTMHMNPGVPIMKSKDLKNWEIVNYAHQAIESNNPKLDLAPGHEAYGEGTWASSLRYHDNMFYVSTFSNTTQKSYIYRTADIEHGPWHVAVLPHFHDASLFFDDGRAYYLYGNTDIRIVELTADATAIKPGGLNQIVLRDPAQIAGKEFILRAEGTQVQKINGWYYINNIVWPSGGGRTQIIHRSRSLTGPYEGRVVLSDNVAQGGLVDTPDGKWYAYLFKDSGAVGRIPYLVPVKWEHDWPVLGENGRVPETLDFEVEDRGVSGIIRSDEFLSAQLNLAWQWNHNPDPRNWSLSDRPGYLRIRTGRVDGSFVEARNTLTQRMFGPTSQADVAIELSGMKDGDYAGLGALQDKYGFIGVVQEGLRRAVVMVNASSGSPQAVERIAIDQDRIYLRLKADFTNQTDQASFYYSLDGSSWQRVGNILQMEYSLAHFMGYRFALFNFGTKSVGGYVDFDYFRVGK